MISLMNIKNETCPDDDDDNGNDGSIDCPVCQLFKVLKQAQHAYLVCQLANKPDLSKLKLKTKTDKVKL